MFAYIWIGAVVVYVVVGVALWLDLRKEPIDTPIKIIMCVFWPIVIVMMLVFVLLWAAIERKKEQRRD